MGLLELDEKRPTVQVVGMPSSAGSSLRAASPSSASTYSTTSSSSSISSLLPSSTPSSPSTSSSPSTAWVTTRHVASKLGVPRLIHRAVGIMYHCIIFMVPSFLQGRSWRERIRPAHLSPTAYLDGMRGLAALFVFFCHFSYQAFTIAESYGAGDNNYSWLKLPFIRIFYQGPAAVCVFFVISGYALSYRPLKLARARAMSDWADTMTSLVFRRWVRLFVPPIVSTFIVFWLIRYGVYEWTREFAWSREYNKMVTEPHYPRFEDPWEQFWDWAWHMFRFVHVWDWNPDGGRTDYDVHLWTIPIEFRCSLYLFLVLTATARLRAYVRVLTVLAIGWFSYRNARWEFCLFLAGMVIAEADLARGAHVKPPATPSPLPVYTDSPSSKEKAVDDDFAAEGARIAAANRARASRALWALTSILGLYLLCYPDGRGEETPGWVYLTSKIPEWWTEHEAPFRYWQSAGAVLFVAAVGHLAGWQRFFCTGPVQYLGKISYAIYLVHGPVMHSCGYMMERWAYDWSGLEGYQYNWGFALSTALCVPAVVFWADVFWRAFDIPTVKFAKWLEGVLVVRT